MAVDEYVASDKGSRPLISSLCPVVVRLVQVRFPELVDHIIPIRPPREMAAWEVKQQKAEELGMDPDEVGVVDIFDRINDGTGGIARFQDGNAQDRALGGKWGYELAAGLALELNWIDSNLSRELDQEFGVNSVNLQAQYARITADNFGRGGIDLTANTFLFGLGFEF